MPAPGTADYHGSRLYLAGRRIHHGLIGLGLIALGAVLAAHDWADRPWPLRDRV